jgi:hypothetical protein
MFKKRSEKMFSSVASGLYWNNERHIVPLRPSSPSWNEKFKNSIIIMTHEGGASPHPPSTPGLPLPGLRPLGSVGMGNTDPFRRGQQHRCLPQSQHIYQGETTLNENWRKFSFSYSPEKFIAPTGAALPI